MGAGTIGGMLASVSPGRAGQAGGARDHLLARPQCRVCVNLQGWRQSGEDVTGYDLCKLFAGSWGTLSVVTEATIKVMPKAESETTLVFKGWMT